jgi:hypothetical protein
VTGMERGRIKEKSGVGISCLTKPQLFELIANIVRLCETAKTAIEMSRAVCRTLR